MFLNMLFYLVPFFCLQMLISQAFSWVPHPWPQPAQTQPWASGSVQ